MRLPDPNASRAVLVGTGSYLPDSGWDPVPSVLNNLERFARILRNESGLQHVQTIPDPSDNEEFCNALSSASNQATDLLLLYYAGHGSTYLNDLHLTHVGSKRKKAGVTTLNFAIVRDLIRQSRAPVRVVILDCCHSGRAIATDSLGGDASAVLSDLTRVDGAYVLTATDSKTPLAKAPQGEKFTAFSQGLFEILESGSSDAGPYLTMGNVYPLVKALMSARNWPEPDAQGTQNAANLGLVPNRLWSDLPGAKGEDPARNAVARQTDAALAEGAREARLGPYSERAEDARRLFGLGLDLVVSNPRDAITVLDQLLKGYQDGPLVYILHGTIARARALVNLDESPAAVAQLDVLLEGITRSFPDGTIQDEAMAKIVRTHVVIANELRKSIVTNEWAGWGSWPPRV